MAEGWPTNAGRVAAELAEEAHATPQRVLGVVRRFGQLVETQAKANASGRPGPRVITGHLRRSINASTSIEGNAVVSRIGSNAPQARRLELGFTGVDSLGRHYNQPPYPYLGPAVDSQAEPFVRALEGMVGGL